MTSLLVRPLGIDIFCLSKKFLVYNLVSRNLKVKYRRSVLGVLWTLAAPVAISVIYYFVFKVILKISIPHYPVFILAGVLFWNFFSMTVIESMESIVANWVIVTKIPIPLQVFPFSGAMTNLTTLLLALPVLWAVAAFSGVPITPAALLLIPAAAWIFLLAYGIGLALAIAFVYLRDLRHTMSILMQIWFYASPVVYDESLIPPKYRFILVLNPLGAFFSEVHRVIMRGELPTLSGTAVCLVWLSFVLLGAALLQRKLGQSLVENI